MLFRGSLIAQASGSVAGNTFSHNRGGQYIRNRSTPTNPNSPAQIVIRTGLADLSQLWSSTLTVAQRAAWDTYAANVPVLNRLGDSIFLTGFNMYIRSNTPRLQAGLPRVDDGPVVFTLGSFTPVTTILTAAGSLIATAFDNTDAWANEDDSSMLVYGARSLNQTINYFRGPFRFSGTIDGNATTPPASPAINASPFTLASTTKAFTRYTVSRADGRLSNEQITSGTVT